MTDKEMIELFRARSEDAIAALRDEYGAYLSSIARRIVGSEEDAAECVSDAYLAAWDSIPSETPKSLKAYLGRLVRNLALDRRRELGAAKRGGGEAELCIEELSECLPAPGGVESAAETRELTEAVERFLRGQPREKRTVFIRRYWSLTPVKELAKELGMSEAKLKSLLFRLRGDLKKYLESEELL